MLQDQVMFLRQFVGTKVKWVGYDPETENFYILFEGTDKAVSFTEFTEIVSGRDFAKCFLQNNKFFAKNVLELDTAIMEVPDGTATTEQDKSSTQASEGSAGAGPENSGTIGSDAPTG